MKRTHKSSAKKLSGLIFTQMSEKRCGVEVFVGVAFALSILVLLVVAKVTEKIAIPGDLQRLEVNLTLLDDFTENDEFFYDLRIPAGKLIAVSATVFESSEPETPTIDINLALLKRPDEVLAINQDIATDNKNSILFHSTGDSDESTVVQVGKLAQPGDEDALFKNFTVSAVEVEELIFVNEIFSTVLEVDELLLSKVFLEAGKTYHGYTFSIDGRLDATESVIRIRSLEGAELLEGFQSTLFERSSKVLFTPPESGFYIVEIRLNFDDEDIIHVLFYEANVTSQDTDFEVSKTYSDQLLLSTESTVLELELEENVEYNFNFTLTLDPSPEVLAEFNLFFFTFIFGPFDALSVRLIEKETNRILERSRTELIGELNGVSSSLTSTGLTSFNFTPANDMIALLDVSRMQPNYVITSFPFVQTKFGNFDLTLTKINELSQEQIEFRDQLADETNIFPECEIDQAKYTINGGCEPGIALFCRNEFFPNLNQENATKAEFSDICDCASFLCSSLPSGENVSKGFQRFLNILYGIFAAVSIICLMLFLLAMCDLIFFGGMKGWMRRGFFAWTVCFIFFLFASIFFFTQISLSNQIIRMKQISENFDNSRIPVPSEDLVADYYVLLALDVFLNFGEDDYYKYDTFLNEEALESVPGSSFNGLRKLILANMISLVFLQSLAVVNFLDVSVVWIESSGSMMLNRLETKRKFKRFKQLIRVVELGFFCLSLGVAIRIVNSNGESYNVLQSVIVFITAVGTGSLYIIGRNRLKILFTLEASKESVSRTINKYWKLVRKVSTIIVVANAGMIIVQLFIIIKVKNFDELVEARNDSIALGLFMFQHMCTLVAEVCIFYYFFIIYKSYRNTLYSRAHGDGKDIPLKAKKAYLSAEQTTYQEDTNMIRSSTNTQELSTKMILDTEKDEGKINMEELI